jgi:hypothetical protein
MRPFAVLSTALAFTFLLLAPQARGQSVASSVTIGGQVGEAIFVSIAPGAQFSDETLPVTYSNLDKHTVRLSISTSGSGARRITIPLQLRSNVGYTLNARVNLKETTLLLRELCVAGVRATGRHVARDATDAAYIVKCADRATNAQAGNANRSSFSPPETLLQGQPISLSGTFDSPFNALEVSLSVEVEAQLRQPQGRVELIITATPRSVASVLMNDGGKR